MVDNKEFSPADLIAEATMEIVSTTKNEKIKIIKSIMYSIDELTAEVKKQENLWKKAQEKLDAKLSKIEKLRNGDWSALKDEKPAAEPAAIA